MGYVYQCDIEVADSCDGEPVYEEDGGHDRPMLTGEFNEYLYDNTPYGDRLRQAGYDPGDLVTVCPDCTLELLDA